MQEQQQQAESNPSPLKEETQPKDDIAVGILLDITGDDTKPPPSLPVLTDTKYDLFNLHINFQSNFSALTTDLLGVDFNSIPLDKPILHRNASEVILPAPIQATTTTNILKTEPKSSSNQSINRLDPFKDLFSSSSTTQKASSNESHCFKTSSSSSR
jgi:hypothetical protein